MQDVVMYRVISQLTGKGALAVFGGVGGSRGHTGNGEGSSSNKGELHVCNERQGTIES